MLDIKFIKENRNAVEENCRNRNIKCDIGKLLELDEKRRSLGSNFDDLQAKKNKLNDAITTATAEDKANIIEEGKKIKGDYIGVASKLKEVNIKYKDLLDKIPNMAHRDTPVGKDESDNKILRKNGKPTKFNFKPKDHLHLGKELDIIDTETAAIVSGARFNYIKGEAALMQFALIQFVLHTLYDKKIISKLAKKIGNPSSKPFIAIVPPAMVKAEIMKKMDRFDPIEDRYYLKEDNILLVGSAEHSMGPMYINKVLNEKEFPLRYIGYSTAFRREAGSYGKDTKGILRCHQFDKLEIESFTTSENGQSEQDFIVAIQEYIIEQLGIPYQVVAICTGDMGKPDYRQIDIECWMPGQDKYRETHTSDYMTDFQARRLNTKVKKENGVELVHMNDATAIAIGRMLVAILENYQQKDGSIEVPKALRKYMPGGIKIIKNSPH